MSGVQRVGTGCRKQNARFQRFCRRSAQETGRAIAGPLAERTLQLDLAPIWAPGRGLSQNIRRCEWNIMPILLFLAVGADCHFAVEVGWLHTI